RRSGGGVRRRGVAQVERDPKQRRRRGGGAEWGEAANGVPGESRTARRDGGRVVVCPAQLGVVGEPASDLDGCRAALERGLVVRGAIEPRGEARGSDVVGRTRFDRDEPLGRG